MLRAKNFYVGCFSHPPGFWTGKWERGWGFKEPELFFLLLCRVMGSYQCYISLAKKETSLKLAPFRRIQSVTCQWLSFN
jgi:hypothetical protein